MRYEDIDWNNVESATATEAGLQLTYKTPPVGVGQTQIVPLELQGTPEQAEEFNARFGGGAAFVGQTMADPRTYRPLVYRPVGSGSAPLRSPPGSYGQVGPMIETHQVSIEDTVSSKAPDGSPGVFYWFLGTWLGPIHSNQLISWVCQRIHEVNPASGQSITDYLASDFMKIVVDGKHVATLQVSQCVVPQPVYKKTSPPGSYALAGTEEDGTVGQTMARYGGTLFRNVSPLLLDRGSPPGSYGQVPNQSFEAHYVKIVLGRYEVWEGVYHGGIDVNLQKFVCAKIYEKFPGIQLPVNTLVTLWIDGKKATTLCPP